MTHIIIFMNKSHELYYTKTSINFEKDIIYDVEVKELGEDNKLNYIKILNSSEQKKIDAYDILLNNFIK